MSDVVVVGAGQAGLQVAASLREAGFAGSITLVGNEPGLPYQRPPLSKAYLAGKIGVEGLWLRPPSFFEEHRIERVTGTVSALDREARRITLADGRQRDYAHLVIATGSRNRPVPFPGADLPGVHQLRTLAEADALAARTARAEAVAVVGAGFIGLEFAAVCARKGLRVTVVEAEHRVMARAVSPETATWFAEAHARTGVAIHYGARVAEIEASAGRATAVVMADGTRISADLVLVGIGVVANDTLAAQVGLAASDGVEVDAFLCTRDPAISAIGDCARFPSRFAHAQFGERVCIESVQNAIDQARCVAARLVGRPRAYDAVPWFWSDQGADKLQIAGLAAPSDDSVAHGDARALTVLRFREGALCAVETVNRPGDHMAARRLLAAGIRIDPSQARDPGFDLRALARSA